MGSRMMAFDGGERKVGQSLGFLSEEHGLVILGMREGFSEREEVATPVGEGVAVDAG